MKLVALISVKLKYIHSMYTYTHKQNIDIHTDQMDSKAKSTQQIKWVVKTKLFIKKNPTKKKMIKSESSRSVTEQNLQNPS